MNISAIMARHCSQIPAVVVNKPSNVYFLSNINEDSFERSVTNDSEIYDIDKSKAELIKYVKYISDRDLTAGSGGNFSVRVGDKILISRAGSMFADFTEDDVCIVDMNGRCLAGDKPSSETPMHLAVYNSRPDVNAIIHFHPTYATVYAVANKTPLPNILPHTTKHFHDLKVAPYENAGSSELARKTALALGASEGLLLGNHGAIVVGKTAKIAAKTADSLENYSKISYLIENSNFKPKTLSKDNVNYMLGKS